MIFMIDYNYNDKKWHAEPAGYAFQGPFASMDILDDRFVYVGF